MKDSILVVLFAFIGQFVAEMAAKATGTEAVLWASVLAALVSLRALYLPTPKQNTDAE